MKILILTMLTMLSMLACNAKKEESDKTEDQHVHSNGHAGSDHRTKDLMAIHDSLMPAMETLMSLEKQLSREMKVTDSLLAIKSVSTLKDKKGEIANLHSQLEKADKEMMNWMHQYKADSLAKLEEEKAQAYIADQTVKITAVRDLMKKSISDAQLFLQKNQL